LGFKSYSHPIQQMYSLKDPLIGLRVQVGIDEPADATQLGWLSGTITRKLPGGGPQYVVHLDNPVRYAHDYGPPIAKRIDWILTDLSIQSRYVGRDLDLLLTQKPPVTTRDTVVVAITNHSTGDYFAIGGVRRV
jgi:hypothetical protein